MDFLFQVVGAPVEVAIMAVVLARVWRLEQALTQHSQRVAQLETRVFGKPQLVVNQGKR